MDDASWDLILNLHNFVFCNAEHITSSAVSVWNISVITGRRLDVGMLTEEFPIEQHGITTFTGVLCKELHEQIIKK